jgi:hypothetical protein
MQPALWDRDIEEAALNADDGFIDAAFFAVIRVAERKQFFTTDDVWEALGERGTHENRAMGAVMRKARSEKVCFPTGNYRPSVRLVAHGRPVRIWQAGPR